MIWLYMTYTNDLNTRHTYMTFGVNEFKVETVTYTRKICFAFQKSSKSYIILNLNTTNLAHFFAPLGN